MTVRYPTIPEDAWVAVYEWGVRRTHKVFSTNGDVLTHCQRWLRRDRVVLADNDNGGSRCQLCEKSS